MNTTQPIEINLSVVIDRSNQRLLIDKLFELSDAICSDGATPAEVFAQFKTELKELGLELSLVPLFDTGT